MLDLPKKLCIDNDVVLIHLFACRNALRWMDGRWAYWQAGREAGRWCWHACVIELSLIDNRQSEPLTQISL